MLRWLFGGPDAPPKEGEKTADRAPDGRAVTPGNGAAPADELDALTAEIEAALAAPAAPVLAPVPLAPTAIAAPAAAPQAPVQAPPAPAPTPSVAIVTTSPELPEEEDEAPDETRRLGLVLAVVNQKGGVGKTTTTTNLGAALAEKKRKVLLVDLDPQGNLTNALGLPLEYPSTYDLLLGEVPASDVKRSVAENALKVRKSSRAKPPVLDILPGIGDLAGLEVELAEREDKDRRLWAALQPVLSEYDYILVDCPPSLGTLTLNALLAANGVVAPLQCEYLALKGFMQLMETVKLVQEALNPRLRRIFMVMTMFNAGTLLSKNVVDDARRQFPQFFMPTLIPRSTRLGEAPSYGQSILRYEPSGRAAEAYRSLANDIDSRLRRDLRSDRGT